jgi:nitrogen-specific signal transduction histidine kinase
MDALSIHHAATSAGQSPLPSTTTDSLPQGSIARHARRSLAHQVRQPLTVILGYAELLETRELSAAQVQEFARHIVKASRELAAFSQRFDELGPASLLPHGASAALTPVARGEARPSA